MIVGEVTEEAQPLNKATLTRLKRVCGLAARQRVGLNCDSFNSLTKEDKEAIFDECIQNYVV